MAQKRIYKVEKDKKIFGVCGGVAEYLGMDPTIVRVIWAILCLGYGIAIIVYLVCAFVFPNKSEVEPAENTTEEEQQQ